MNYQKISSFTRSISEYHLNNPMELNSERIEGYLVHSLLKILT